MLQMHSACVPIAAALAREHQADLVTGDPEFKAAEKETGIQWIGSNTLCHRFTAMPMRP
jgi:hypothetical protein